MGVSVEHWLSQSSHLCRDACIGTSCWLLDDPIEPLESTLCMRNSQWHRDMGNSYLYVEMSHVFHLYPPSLSWLPLICVTHVFLGLDSSCAHHPVLVKYDSRTCHLLPHRDCWIWTGFSQWTGGRSPLGFLPSCGQAHHTEFFQYC